MPRYIDADEIAEYIICDDGGGMGCEMGNPNGHYLAKSIGYLVKSYKKRCATYRKNGCYFYYCPNCGAKMDGGTK